MKTSNYFSLTLNKLKFTDDIINSYITNISNSNNIYNKILDGRIELTDDIIFLLIIINLDCYYYESNTSYSDLYYIIYDLINDDNDFIDELCWDFYLSFIKINETNTCYPIFIDNNLEWLNNLFCGSDNLDKFKTIDDEFKEKYKYLQIKNRIKLFFNYDIKLINKNIEPTNQSTNQSINESTNQSNTISYRFFIIHANNCKSHHDKIFNIFSKTCENYNNGNYKKL